MQEKFDLSITCSNLKKYMLINVPHFGRKENLFHNIMSRPIAQ